MKEKILWTDDDDVNVLKTIIDIRDGSHDSTLSGVISPEHLLKAHEFGVHLARAVCKVTNVEGKDPPKRILNRLDLHFEIQRIRLDLSVDQKANILKKKLVDLKTKLSDKDANIEEKESEDKSSNDNTNEQEMSKVDLYVEMGTLAMSDKANESDERIVAIVRDEAGPTALKANNVLPRRLFDHDDNDEEDDRDQMRREAAQALREVREQEDEKDELLNQMKDAVGRKDKDSFTKAAVSFLEIETGYEDLGYERREGGHCEGQIVIFKDITIPQAHTLQELLEGDHDKNYEKIQFGGFVTFFIDCNSLIDALILKRDGLTLYGSKKEGVFPTFDDVYVDLNGKKCFAVGNQAPGITADTLKQVFNTFEGFRKSRMHNDKLLVEFRNEISAQQCCEYIHGMVIRGLPMITYNKI